MIGVDAGSGDPLVLGVLTQYRMATTEQMHRVIRTFNAGHLPVP